MRKLFFIVTILLLSFSNVSAQKLTAYQSGNGLWGFRDSKTKAEVIKPQYSDAHGFSFGYAAVKKNGKWFYINKSGQKIYDGAFDKAGNFNEYGEAIVNVNGEWGSLTPAGLLKAEGPTITVLKDSYQQEEKLGWSREEYDGSAEMVKGVDWGAYAESKTAKTRDELFSNKEPAIKKYVHKNGKTYSQGTEINGAKNGEWIFYQPITGKPIYTELWKNGLFTGVKNIYDINGNLISEKGTGTLIWYNEHDEYIAGKSEYQNGSRSGISIRFHKNGKIKQKALYKYDPNDVYGLRWEIIEINDSNGKPLPKGTLKNGNGTWISYDDNDKPTIITTYQNGKKVKEETSLVKDIDKIYENIIPQKTDNKIIAEGTTAERTLGNHSYEMSKGLYEISTGDNNAAFNSFKTAAEKGEHEAMAYLGMMYYEGLGTAKDYKKAYEWILKAKNQGNAKAAYQLGIMYYNGNGVTKSYAEAYKWYNVAAAKGVADADYNIGLLFESGKGVDKNLQTAFNHLKKAADNGSLPGAYATGIYYYYGSAGEKNIPAALKYTLMAEKAFTKAPDYYNHLAYCYFENGELQMALNKLAVAMKIDPTYANGYDSMGEMYLKSGNKTLAIEYYKKAAQMGHDNAIKWCKNNNITY